jgi:hypothetical protein
MFNASHVAETIHEAHNFGSDLSPLPPSLISFRFKVGETSFDWKELKRYRDRYIERLNRIYETGLDKTDVSLPLPSPSDSPSLSSSLGSPHLWAWEISWSRQGPSW